MFWFQTGEKILSQIANTHSVVGEVIYILNCRGRSLGLAFTIYEN